MEEDEIGTGLTGGDMNDPTLSGIDEEEVDPNLLHQDPETGKNYTDLTDEQGNEVPDLRFDQNPDSIEEQPEVELEFEIVTKEEYESHLDTEMSQDEFDAELQNPTGEEPMVEDPMNPFEEIDEPKENPFEEIDEPKENPFEETEDIIDEPTDDMVEEPKENPFDKPTEDKPKKKTPTEDKPKKKTPKKETPKKETPKKETPKEDEESDEEPMEETPKNKGTVTDIINREKELIESGIDEEDLLDLLEAEFGEDKVDKAQETKSWRNRR